jgi:hypothetical protein
MSENGKTEEFKIYKGVVHLKHTGTELITDIVAISEEGNFITVKNPCYLQSMATEDGKSQMALVPFLMTSSGDEVHLPLGDILFMSECRKDVAEQHTQMFSSVILPKHTSKIIM